MEVIKKSTDHMERTARFACKSCDSLIGAKRSEGREEHDRDWNYVILRCPVCKVENWVVTALFNRN
jgi:RNase P subunit RPR2